MAIKEQTHVQCTVISKKGYCPVFDTGDQFHFMKHCMDTSSNQIEKYCIYTLGALIPQVLEMRKQAVGTCTTYKCKDNGIITIEIQRMPDVPYDFENHR